MPSAAKAGLGLGTSVAGGAATGAAFGPIGAGIGAGVGGLLGLLGMGAASEDEEELKRRRDQAKKQAIVQALRGRAAELGASTRRLDMPQQIQGIEEQYQQGLDQMNRIGPQDYAGLLSAGASLGGQVKDWMKAPPPMTGQPVRNADLYGVEGKTGLRRDEYGNLVPM